VEHPEIRFPTESIDTALRSKPVVVKLSAEKKLFTPFLGNVPIEVAAVGWVQQFPKAGFDISSLTSSNPGDPTGGGCPQPDYCGNDFWHPGECLCCDEQLNTCQRGATWNTDRAICGCECSTATVDCPIGTSYVNDFNCECIPCPNGHGIDGSGNSYCLPEGSGGSGPAV